MPDASVLGACTCLLSTKEDIRRCARWRPTGTNRHGSCHESLARFALPFFLRSSRGSLVRPLLRRSCVARLARVLNVSLMKMGRTGLQHSHAVGRRQASLGTPVPRTPTLAAICTCTCYVRASTTTRARLYYDTCTPLHRPVCTYTFATRMTTLRTLRPGGSQLSGTSLPATM